MFDNFYIVKYFVKFYQSFVRDKKCALRNSQGVFFFALRFFLCNDHFAVVSAAVRANTVGEVVLAAVRAFCHAGSIQLPDVRTALVSASLRNFFLRYCHLCYLLDSVSANDMRLSLFFVD